MIIISVSWAANRHIRMISEGSCDAEDWRNNAENWFAITGVNYILKYIQIVVINCNSIAQYYCLLDSWSNKCSFKNPTDPKYLKGSVDHLKSHRNVLKATKVSYYINIHSCLYCSHTNISLTVVTHSPAHMKTEPTELLHASPHPATFVF